MLFSSKIAARAKTNSAGRRRREWKYEPTQRAGDRGRALEHAADEADQRAEDARAQRGGIVAQQPVAAQDEDHDQRGDEDGEGALVELREQQRADGRPDDGCPDERGDTAKQMPAAESLEQQERVRHEDGDRHDRHGHARTEHASEDRSGDERQAHSREALGEPGHAEPEDQNDEVDRAQSASATSERQST